MTIPTPSLELDAVNEILLWLSRPLLAAFNTGQNVSPDESAIRFHLKTQARILYTMKDWRFNSARDVTFPSDGNGRVLLEEGSVARILRCTLNVAKGAPAPIGQHDVVERKDMSALDGGAGDGKYRLFDFVKNRFDVFGANSTVSLDVTYSREPEEIPEAARRWIIEAAKKQTSIGRKVSRELLLEAEKAQGEAMALLDRDHLIRGALNSMQRQERVHPTIVDNWDAGRLLVHQSYDLLTGG